MNKEQSTSEPDGSIDLDESNRRPSGRRLRESISTPFRFLMITAVSLFVVEGFVMFLFSLLPPLSPLTEGLLDTSLLTVLVFPALYFFLFRPMVLHIARYNQAQEKLQKAHDELEVEVAERTAALTATNEALRESELRFRSVWDKCTDGMRITNEEGIVQLVNDAYCKMMEKPREEIEGKPIGIVYEEAKQAEVLRKHQERFRSRNIPAYLERDIILWNGKRISLELSNSFIEIPHQPTLSLSVFRDVTERKHAEEALKESEARYRTLFERVPVGLYQTTLAGQILDGNPAIIQMLGYPDRETYLKVNAADLYVNSEDRKQWQMLIEGQEIVRDFEEQLHQSDGTVIWVQDNTRAVRDAGGQVLYYEGILQDITQRKKMEEEREKLIVELQDVLANIKTLSGLVPICASCKKIRDDKGYWNHLEQYIMDHSDATLSHGICPDCAKKLYPEFFDKK